ncbi:uncharacterized protein LOC123524767 [Mercenaria mercenaria]|uniref:uncharacterized protein LOC123524767 n=1 Tax=Mercenaria mercenaria TaxID=6596 RepID=UPI00234E787F|nr:uncharacterized protein LOC123524767 [Mercenaria mercenaria]
MAFGGRINSDILCSEMVDLPCTMCERKGRCIEAEKYCVECQDYYCLRCVNVHGDVPSLSRHNIFDKGQFPSESVHERPGTGKALPLVLTERCNIHTHHFVDMYCQNHDDVGCGTCMALDHRSCHHTFYIPEFLQNNTRILPAKTMLKKIESIATILEVNVEKLRNAKQEILTKKLATVETIRRIRKEFNERLEELEKNTLAHTEIRYKHL